MEGLGITACSLECLACLNHVHGWTIWGGYGTLPLKPRFLVASDRSQVARRRVRLDLGDLGIIEQQLNQCSNQLGSKPLPSCDAFASDWSIPRTPGSVSSSTIRPRFQSNVRLGIPNRLSIQHCNVWSDGLLR